MAFKSSKFIKEIIKLKEKYTITQLLKKYNCHIEYTDNVDIKGCTINIGNENLILLNSNLNKYDKHFILLHELAHIILHNDNERIFYYNKTFSSLETEANLFATIFGDYTYNEFHKSDIQKTINNIYINYLVNDKVYNEWVLDDINLG